MRATRRKITSADEAQSLLDELHDSGDDPSTFCQRRGIDGRSLNCWRLNLRRGHAVGKQRKPMAESMRIVEVAWPEAPETAVGAACAEPWPGPSEGRYRVTVGETVIEVDDAFREDTLARLLALVRAC